MIDRPLRHPRRRHLPKLLAVLLSLVLALLQGSAVADGMDDDEAYGAPPLAAAADGDLQASLERLVRDQGLWRHVESGRLALGLADISDLDHPRYAALNPDRMMYAASLPKIAILLGVFVKVEAGGIELDDPLREEMVRMIRYSDNGAATRLLDRVGRDDLIDILTSERFGFYDPARNGGLWVGKDYARKGAYRRDPLNNLSHGATVHQVMRFFYLLERGDLFGGRFRDEMKAVLSEPGIRHKFVAGLEDRPGKSLYRKSGTWREYHADAALVEAGDHRYIMVGIARHRNGGKWLAHLAAPMHDLVVGPPPEGG